MDKLRPITAELHVLARTESRHIERARAIDHNPHRALLIVFYDKHNRPTKIRISELRNGNHKAWGRKLRFDDHKFEHNCIAPL
jgi:hypothetical protein